MSPLVVMGVQGSGKSTIGALLAHALSVPFIDGDDLHSEANKELMAAGRPLDDAHRLPWLRAVGAELASHSGGVVIACSALKRSYRDVLRQCCPQVRFVHPHGPIELVASRVASRRHEYMPPGLLTSQYQTLEPLEPDEAGIALDLSGPEATPEQLAAQAQRRLSGSAG